MGEPIAVLALRRKRDQISGIIAEYERKISAAQHDLAHVVASLRLFELTGDPSDFPAYIDLNRLLRRGETSRLCIAALAAEGPLDTRELAQRVMLAKGLNDAQRTAVGKNRGPLCRLVSQPWLSARRRGAIWKRASSSAAGWKPGASSCALR